ncbi:MAG TPA: hypothetical protein PKI19_01750 [Elusimicrobiales bacterium]|nr:hypothetical protein [Elusimicrobiales bacterium]
MSAEISDTVKKTAWRGRAAAFLAGSFALVLFWTGLELTCGYLNNIRAHSRSSQAEEAPPARRPAPRSYGLAPAPPEKKKRLNREAGQPEGDTRMSYAELPNAPGEKPGRRTFRETCETRSGELIYDVKYVKDEFGRRVTPGEERKKAGRFLLLMGDSFIFGQGVAQNETLAAFLGGEMPHYRIYNYGVTGLMPGELLDWARAITGAPELGEKSGTVLYFYDNRHISRNMGSFFDIGNWGAKKPYYFEDASGRIRTEGTQAETRPLRTLLAKLYARSAVFRYFRLDFPGKPRKADWLFEVKLLRQLREAARGFGADKFLVVLYPDNPGEQLTPYLEEARIAYIDLSRWKMGDLTEGPPGIRGDGHPTPESNKVLAHALAPLIERAAEPDQRPPGLTAARSRP